VHETYLRIGTKAFFNDWKLGLFVNFVQFLLFLNPDLNPNIDPDPDPGEPNQCGSMRIQILNIGVI
jgi:hypothetical protein